MPKANLEILIIFTIPLKSCHFDYSFVSMSLDHVAFDHLMKNEDHEPVCFTHLKCFQGQKIEVFSAVNLEQQRCPLVSSFHFFLKIQWLLLTGPFLFQGSFMLSSSICSFITGQVQHSCRYSKSKINR